MFIYICVQNFMKIDQTLLKLSWTQFQIVHFFILCPWGMILRMGPRPSKLDTIRSLIKYTLLLNFMIISQERLKLFYTQVINVPFFTYFCVLWPWKLGQGHQNLIRAGVCPYTPSFQIWRKSVKYFSCKPADKTSVAHN